MSYRDPAIAGIGDMSYRETQLFQVSKMRLHRLSCSRKSPTLATMCVPVRYCTFNASAVQGVSSSPDCTPDRHPAHPLAYTGVLTGSYTVFTPSLLVFYLRSIPRLYIYSRSTRTTYIDCSILSYAIGYLHYDYIHMNAKLRFVINDWNTSKKLFELLSETDWSLLISRWSKTEFKTNITKRTK